jgi:hypothetical protein
MPGKELATRERFSVARKNEDRDDGTLIMEDARIVFRNFAGAEGMYNREGDRNFCVLLDDGTADMMMEDGWNIKRLKPRDGAEQGTAYIQVSVGYKGRPPRTVMITSKGKVELDEETIILLDWADMLTVDLIIRPYHWNVNGRTGVKAYLKSIFVVINEDFLELKYKDVPDAELSSAKTFQIEAGDGVGQEDDIEFDENGDEIVDAELVD